MPSTGSANGQTKKQYPANLYCTFVVLLVESGHERARPGMNVCPDRVSIGEMGKGANEDWQSRNNASDRLTQSSLFQSLAKVL